MTRPFAVLGRLTVLLETWLARSWFLATFAAGLAALVVGIKDETPGIPVTAALGFLVSLGLTRTLNREDRAIALGLFGWALAFRLLIVLSLVVGSTEYTTGGLLSPDGIGYLNGSLTLVRSGFPAGSPFALFGTYDIGQYYVFAAVLKAFGSDFTVLAAFNAAISALAAPFAFAWARLVITKHAVVVGGVAAASPSLALMATTNLLKDPIVILVTLVVALSVAQALRNEPWGPLYWVWLVIGATALAFLHTTRFYVAAYLELGILIAVAVQLTRNPGRPLWRTRVLGLLAVILVAEVLAGGLGWPNSADMVTSQVQFVSGSRGMQPALEQDNQGNRVPGVTTAVDVARRLLGPYVWVPPTTLDLKYLILADFDLYTDTVIWYVILPFLAIGIAMALLSLLKEGGPGPTSLGYLAIFVSVYLAQYLAINLSYRQREDVLLLALAFVPAGARAVLSRRPGQLLYASYWFVLVGVAAGHLLLRAKG